MPAIVSLTANLTARFHWVLIALLAAAAAISLRVGIRGALSSSKDFQWTGAYLLRTGVDPWQSALMNHGRDIAHFSPPNYLHELYILLLPISFLSFQHAVELWCALNILLSIASVCLLKRLFSLSRFAAIAILLLLWMSAPFRTTLQVGQMSVFELFLLCLVFCTQNSTLRGLALGFSFSKYSFAPIIVSLLWFKRNIRTLIIAIIVPVLGLFAAWGLLGVPFIHLAAEPFAVSRIYVWPGMADLMTAIEAMLIHLLPGFGADKALAYAIGLLLSGLYGFYLSRRRLTDGALLTLVAVASLFTIKHLMYDYIFLVIPLCYVASELGKTLRPVVLPIIGIFWFMDRFFPPLPLNGPATDRELLAAVLGCCLLGGLFTYLTWSIVRLERTYFHVQRLLRPASHGLDASLVR
jgi:hypothetical protein